MKVLYVGDLVRHGTCRHRMEALRRLGLDVEGVDLHPVIAQGGRLARALRLRSLLGPAVARLNREVLERAAVLRPDLVWFDKPVLIRPETVAALRAAGRLLVHYCCDNPFAAAAPVGMWRLLRHSIPLFDLNLVPRLSNIEEYRRAGGRLTAVMPFAFDPWHDFPAARPERTMPLAFIGSPHDRRAGFLARMAAQGIDIHVSGPRWRRERGFSGAGDGYWGDDYRHAIWRAGMCMAFITRANRDTCAHKAFEIAACGTALLAERSEHHAELFAEDDEAAFFSTPEEAADKARWHAAHPQARERMARQGCRRAWTSGYSNDERLAAAMGHLDPALGARLAATARQTMSRRRAELGL